MARSRGVVICILLGMLFGGHYGLGSRLLAQPAGQDLRLTYRSKIDATDQPYRVYVPAAHDGQKRLPLVIALHGTGGNEASLFDDKQYLAAADAYLKGIERRIADGSDPLVHSVASIFMSRWDVALFT